MICYSFAKNVTFAFLIILQNFFSQHDEEYKYNYTCITPTVRKAQRLESVINGIMLTLILPVSTVVICTLLIYYKWTKQTITSPYLITLFISDSLHSLTVLLLTLNREALTNLNQALCQCVLFVYSASCTYSLCMLAVISTIRYRTLQRRTLNDKNNNHIKRNVGILFLSSAMCAIPAVLYVQVEKKKGNYGKCNIHISTQKAYDLFIGIKIVYCFLWGIFPTVIFSYFYVIFGKTLRALTQSKHNKTLSFISLLILSFLCIQIPNLLVMSVEIFFLYIANTSCLGTIQREIVQIISRLMPEIHCLSNPLVYAFTRTDFRLRFYDFIKCNLCNSSLQRKKNPLTIKN